MSRSLRLSREGVEKAGEKCKEYGKTQEYLAGASGTTRQTVIKFLKGQSVDRQIFLNICASLDLNWGEVVESDSEQESTDSVINRSKTLIANTSKNSHFQALIDDKTKDFVGREYVFQEIEDFLSRESKGYFIIEGTPGIGKSAILAKFVRKTNCITHFNIQGETDSFEQFLENISQQLIDRYKLTKFSFLSEATRENKLSKLITEASKKLASKERLVIVVDALDEVDESCRKKILNSPGYLPNNVYLIMTQRRGTESNFPPGLPLYKLDLTNDKYQQKSREDVREYVGRAAATQQVSQWMINRAVTVEVFIETLVVKSENNFMYLFYVLGDIKNNRYEDLSIENLPRGLENYYKWHWDRMGMNAQPLPVIKINIIYIISVSKQAVSRQWIANKLKESELTVQMVLKEWSQFLRDSRLYSPPRYSFYHLSFQDFLYRNDIIQAAGVDLKKLTGLIVDNYLEDFDNFEYE